MPFESSVSNERQRRAFLQGLGACLVCDVLRGPTAWAGGLRVGAPAPAATLVTLDGQRISTTELRGQVVILTFWATWCSPCRAEMPQLDAFYKRYRARGLELLGVSVDDAQDRDAVVRVMKSFSYPAALAAAAKANDFGAPIAVPMTWIIDAKGVVRARLMAGNAATLQSLEQAVLPLLPQAAATHAP